MHPWRERLSRWLDPIGRAWPFSPNAITVLALLINLAAATLLALGAAHPPFFLIAIALIVIGGFADALDGVVARLQKKETRFGDFLDHVCDRISDTALAACWMIGNRVREPLVVAAVVLIMLNGYIGTQIEATFHERNYESLGRGEFVLALVIFPIVAFILFTNGWSSITLAGATIAEWLSILLLAFALLGIAQRVALARRMERR